MEANATLSSSVIEDINGIETIKSLASEKTRYQKIDELPFDFERRRMSVIVKEDDEAVLVTKGSTRRNA